MVLHSIGSSIFPGGVPLYSTSHIQNGNFKASGEIVAASIAQGGPPPCFLDENVYGLMVNPNVPLHELNAEMHLTESDRALLESVQCDVIAHTDIIIDHGYTGKIDDPHINEILQSIIISIVTKRLVCLKEFMDGLNSYGLGNILQIHPDTCKGFFVQGVQNDAVDANYLFSIIQPKFSEPGSIRKEKEESMMDFLQDFLFQLEDTPNLPGNSEESSSCEDTDNACASGGNVEDMAMCADTNSEGKDSRAASSGNVIAGCIEDNGATEDPDEERPVVTDYTPACIMGWLTGQKHKPLDGKPLKTTMIFDHDCLIHNPNHRICFPVVRACTKEVSFPVTHGNS